MIHSTAYLGPDVTLGYNVMVDAYAVLNNVSIGDNCYIGPGAVVGGTGFGYSYDSLVGWTLKPHEFRVIIEENVHIGANTCVDRGSWRDTIIGQGSKIDNLVHIAHNAIIGADCCIVAGAEVSGSCELDDRVYIGPNACVRERLSLGEGCIVGMGAVVVKHVAPRTVVAGNPARLFGPVTDWPPLPPATASV